MELKVDIGVYLFAALPFVNFENKIISILKTIYVQ